MRTNPPRNIVKTAGIAAVKPTESSDYRAEWIYMDLEGAGEPTHVFAVYGFKLLSGMVYANRLYRIQPDGIEMVFEQADDTTPIAPALQSDGYSITAIDVEGDGRQELLVSLRHIYVFQWTGETFRSLNPTKSFLPSDFYEAVLEDVDGDGVLEFVGRPFSANGLWGKRKVVEEIGFLRVFRFTGSAFELAQDESYWKDNARTQEGESEVEPEQSRVDVAAMKDLRQWLVEQIPPSLLELYTGSPKDWASIRMGLDYIVIENGSAPNFVVVIAVYGLSMTGDLAIIRFYRLPRGNLSATPELMLSESGAEEFSFSGYYIGWNLDDTRQGGMGAIDFSANSFTARDSWGSILAWDENHWRVVEDEQVD